MDTDSSLHTDFLPAERAQADAIAASFTRIERFGGLTRILDAVPDSIIILNEHRQIVFANRAMLGLLRIEDLDDVLGARPGEVLNCVNSGKNPGGCGTTEFCRECGTPKVLAAAAKHGFGVEECRILRKNGDALDLRVHAAALELEKTRYTVFTAADVADEKRRKALERIFFHDVLNTAGNLRGIMELYQELDPGEKEAYMEMAHDLSERLIEEIESQRQLTMAESGELRPETSTFNSLEVLQEVTGAYRHHSVARNKILRLDHRLAALFLETDRTLARRVVGNMVKNALEATDVGGTVTVGCKAYEEKLEFWVHNDGAMPDSVRRQIFQRSFSTKGSNRGLGTYSIKLLTERYLGGTAGFTTGDEGTRFFAQVPFKS
jgi:signal transduction histidine kinase